VKAALRIGPAFVLGNVMWAALIAAAWHCGLLAPFLGAGGIELRLLGVIGVLFLVGQGAILVGEFDAADRIAQWLPAAGLGCFLLALLHLGFNADLSTGAGKAAFARSVIESMALTCAAVVGMVVLESVIWASEGRGDA
jgi:hypothetical protein